MLSLLAYHTHVNVSQPQGGDANSESVDGRGMPPGGAPLQSLDKSHVVVLNAANPVGSELCVALVRPRNHCEF